MRFRHGDAEAPLKVTGPAPEGKKGTRVTFLPSPETFKITDFDFEKFEPFLKYNEDWIKETAAFGHAPEHVQLERFVADWYGWEWRDSAVVPALKGKIVKKTEDNFSSKGWIEIPTPVCAVIFTPENLAKYKKREDGARFYLVKADEVAIYELKYRSWKRLIPENDQPAEPRKDPFSPPESEKDSKS